MQKIITALQQIEELCKQDPDLLGMLTQGYCRKHDLARSSVIAAAYEELSAGEQKMLNIGIVGRVKAGKSSLLNAIFFNGKDILPKAATPMTASLTVLSYGSNEASVELFSAGDIADIKKEHDAYVALQEQKLQETLAQVQQKRKQPLTPEQHEKLRQNVVRSMQSVPTKSYFELYEGMVHDPRLSTRLAQIQQSAESITETINASTPEDLAQALNRYVGSSGENNAITKSAELKLDLPELQDLRIIDTPGLDDPVASRSQRTIDFMKHCDVIFVISPCSQFMSAADVSLMVNACQEQSIHQICVVGSQADMTMISDVADKNGHDLAASWDYLGQQLQQSLQDCMKGSERKVLQETLRGAPVLLTSSICFSLERKLRSGGALSEDEKHVLANLAATYPQDFTTDEQKAAALQRLAGIEAVKEKLKQARSNKDAIIKERQVSFARDHQAAVERYVAYLQQQVRANQEQLAETDLAELVHTKAKLVQLRQSLGLDLNLACGRSFTQLQGELSRSLDAFGQCFVKNTGDGAHKQLATKTETYTYTTGWLWWKRDHIGSTTTTSIDPTQVRLEVQRHYHELVLSVNKELAQLLYDWIDQTVEAVLGVIQQLDSDLCLDYGLGMGDIKRAVKLSIYELRDRMPRLDLAELDAETHSNDKHFTFLFSRSASSTSGKLYNNEAEAFMVKVGELLAWAKSTFDHKSEQFLEQFKQLAQGLDLSQVIFGKLDQQVADLEQHVADKERTNERYRAVQERLAQIAKDLTAPEGM